jgi:hypothetical protein
VGVTVEVDLGVGVSDIVEVGFGLLVGDGVGDGFGVRVCPAASVARWPTTAPNVDVVTGEARSACPAAFAVAVAMIEMAVSSTPGACDGIDVGVGVDVGGCVGVTSTTIGVAGAQAPASVKNRTRLSSLERLCLVFMRQNRTMRWWQPPKRRVIPSPGPFAAEEHCLSGCHPTARSAHHQAAIDG